MDYKTAGVNVSLSEKLVRDFKFIGQQNIPGVITTKSGFASLFDLSVLSKYDNPVIATATDGVGTKIQLALDTGMIEGIGQDLVAMSVNDIITCGAKPLCFLDYYATKKLDKEVFTTILKSIDDACQSSGCVLIGGETAEMNTKSESNGLDLGGFCVGIVERDNIIDGANIHPGDLLLGLRSSGFHSNGYSLIREIIKNKDISAEIYSQIMEPTTIYSGIVQKLINHCDIKGMAHITGGGAPRNLERMLPKGLVADITYYQLEAPPIMEYIIKEGNIDREEACNVFNMGVGYVFCIRPQDLKRFTNVIKEANLHNQLMLVGTVK